MNRPNRRCLLVVAFLVLPVWSDASTENKRRQLEDLQKRIGELEETLAETRGHRVDLVQELGDLERSGGVLSKTLHDIESNLTERSEALALLQQVRAEKSRSLRKQRGMLARQVSSAFLLGRQERLTLLLNQEDSGLVSRIMSYHEYLIRDRAARIQATRERVVELRAVEAEVVEEQTRLARLRAEQLTEQKRLHEVRDRRQALMLELDRSLHDKDTALRVLKRDAGSLRSLIERLTQSADEEESAADKQPLRGRKGQLSWPVQGRIHAEFGTQRASGGLVWDGVVLAAAAGTEVAALHHGRVAFADWLRGFGLMIILDHGDGYMTLYGFNQTLLKETGEWVEEGEAIALLGDTGGRHRPGLYFGIRHRGKAQNPRRWCRRPRGDEAG